MRSDKTEVFQKFTMPVTLAMNHFSPAPICHGDLLPKVIGENTVQREGASY